MINHTDAAVAQTLQIMVEELRGILKFEGNRWGNDAPAIVLLRHLMYRLQKRIPSPGEGLAWNFVEQDTGE